MKLPMLLLTSLIVAVSMTVNAQTIYHCTKNGKKVMSDQPCEHQGAIEQRRVDVQDMPPLNTSQPLTPGQIQQSQQIDQRLQQENVVSEHKRQYEKAKIAQDQANNQKVCDDLERYRKQVIDQQRVNNNDWWNAEHRRVDDEMYKRGCKTL
ncbi:hypothetical protein [Propionivibrio sp.]|uniref:hypothetical protein n=1 Tax=Propionivibrio sp. TaxID=2212460 RepID=UPI0025D1A664|nr:hypothetical protein [Propionivibrio sp.]MBK8744154.1 DUF4124 domain-containing protein [Propionivibrio sp.]